MEKFLEDILRRCRRYIKAKKISATAFGVEVLGTPGLIKRLEHGRGDVFGTSLTIKTVARVEAFLKTRGF